MATKNVRKRKYSRRNRVRVEVHPPCMPLDVVPSRATNSLWAKSWVQNVVPGIIFAASFLLFLVARAHALKGSTDVIRWDGAWYRNIIENGYSTDGITIVQHNVAFLPLYPLICSAVRSIFSLTTPTAMTVVSATATLLTLVVTSILLRRHYSSSITNLTLLFLAFNPYAVFWFNGYSEPVFFLVAAVFLLCLDRGQFALAALAVGVASAGRPYACLLVIVFVWELARQHYKEYGTRITLESRYVRAFLLLPPLCFLGIAAHTLWLWIRFADPLAFVHALEGWEFGQRSSFGLQNAFIFRHKFVLLHDSVMTIGALSPFSVGLMFFLAVPALLMVFGRRLFSGALMFIIVMFLFNHWMGLQTYTSSANLGRHLALMLPVSLLIAIAVDAGTILSVIRWLGLEGRYRELWRLVAAVPSLALVTGFIALNVRYINMFFSSQFVS